MARSGLDQVEHLKHIVLALARGDNELEMAKTITDEFRRILNPIAICTFLKRTDGQFHLAAEFGCTPEFVQTFAVMPTSSFPQLEIAGASGILHFTDSEEFKAVFPGVLNLVQRSGRAVTGYAPLTVDDHITGVIGFSFNRIPELPVDLGFVSLLVSLGAQALERARLSELEIAANRAKSDFLANISHEIRTPLGLVQGYIDLFLRSCLLDERQQRWAEVIYRNTRQLTGLIGEVLDISKIEADRIEISNEVVAIQDLIAEVHQTAILRAGEKSIALRFDCADLPPYIFSDPVRLRQILLNLVGNAIKFTCEGMVSIKICLPNPETLEFEVSDTGIGIPAEFQGRIFDAFTQVESSNRRRFGGTGLGLTIARNCARALGGELELVWSALGQGSCFCFRVRTRVATDLEVHKAKQIAVDNQVALVKLNRVHVLLVDDSEDNQDLIGHLLRECGAEVDVASSGHRALVMAQQNHFDVILMDIQMPEMDGHETFSALRAKGCTQPVVALTAHALKSERERALANGFNAYLTKPVDRQQLCATIKELAH